MKMKDLGNQLAIIIHAEKSWIARYFSYQRFWRVNEANESFSIVLTHEPRLHAAFDKRSFAYRLKELFWITEDK